MMKTKHFLVSSLVILSIVFLGLQLLENEMYASIIRAVMIILVTLLYYNQAKTSRSYFFMFLAFFSLAEIIGVTSLFNKVDPDTGFDYNYYMGNGLYILSYIFLIIKVLKSMNLRKVITKLPVHVIILVVLDIFCVTIVTDTTKGQLSIYQYSLEFLYNAVIMSLLTLAVINYINNVDKKAMNLLIGSLFIVFSEMIQLAYFYVLEINVLNVLCSLFLVIGFLLLYLHETLAESEEQITYKEHLEA
ncbi:hypothetical protein ACS386_12220 [Flavobacteriaceae bacterium LMO-SS05]